MAAEFGELKEIAARIRGKLVEVSSRCRTAHLGSAMSCADIMSLMYWSVLNLDPAAPGDPDRDRFILSKGHAATALYAALGMRGFFSLDLLDGHGEPGNCLEEHPGPGCAPGVEAATGSLGHGLPMGAGLALGARLTGRQFRVFCLMSDGECNEGSVWEAAMFAPKHKLDNLCVLVDFNKWQATGRSCEVMALEPLADKWKAFGWNTHEVDGHDIEQLSRILSGFPSPDGRPTAIVAHTIKGKGVSFMEDDNNWHYRIPSEDEVAMAKKELGLI